MRKIEQLERDVNNPTYTSSTSSTNKVNWFASFAKLRHEAPE